MQNILLRLFIFLIYSPAYFKLNFIARFQQFYYFALNKPYRLINHLSSIHTKLIILCTSIGLLVGVFLL